MSRLPLALLILACLGACRRPAPPPEPPAPAAPPHPLERASRVLDGDTIEIGAERIRLKGINAPESGECGAAEATTLLSALIADGARVDRRGRGDHGRTLAYLFGADGRAAHVALAEAGLVLAYPYGDLDDQSAAIASAEGSARLAARGLFSPSACGAPVAGAAAVSIRAVVANPPGDDLVAEGGEYVEIAGPPGMALGGWTVKDTSARNRYRFAADVALPPGGALRLYTACGTAAPDRLFWCRTDAGVWNNTGDTAFLLDPNGNLVAERASP